MTSRLGIIMALLILQALCKAAWGQTSKDWVDVQGASELRTLIAGKSFQDGWGTVRAFRGDGKGLFVMSGGGKRIPNTWAVKGANKVCATPLKGNAECWSVRRSRRDQHLVSFVFDNGVIMAYQVKDGVPSF